LLDSVLRITDAAFVTVITTVTETALLRPTAEAPTVPENVAEAVRGEASVGVYVPVIVPAPVQVPVAGVIVPEVTKTGKALTDVGEDAEPTARVKVPALMVAVPAVVAGAAE